MEGTRGKNMKIIIDSGLAIANYLLYVPFITSILEFGCYTVAITSVLGAAYNFN